MRLLIAAGGTGGHIYPALAVARSLQRRASGAEVAWLGGRRGFEDRIVREAGIPLRRLWLRSLRSVEADLHLVLDPLRLAASVGQALALLGRERPAAIFTTGGYMAIPVLLSARILGVPVVLWEGNVEPGRSVRATARFARAVAVSFRATCSALRLRAPCYETGTPIRETQTIDRLAARERLGVRPERRLLLIFGGSQAVRRFSAAVSEALPQLVERWSVVHVTGAEGHAPALADRARLPAELRERYRPEAFLGESLLDALAAADLVVGRAGSSTLAEVTAFGLPMIVVPYRYAGGHQHANAEAMAASGAARLIEDEDLDGPALLAAVRPFEDAATHATMAAASRSLGRPGAADAVADLVLGLARREPLPSEADLERRSRRVPVDLRP